MLTSSFDSVTFVWLQTNAAFPFLIQPKQSRYMSKVTKTSDAKSVLIVEDSADFSNLLKFIVDDMGYEGVQFALDKDDIVVRSKECNAEAILMDLQLRRKNGLQYIEELKSDSTTKHIPIIIISGRDLGQKELLELQMKDVKYLRKGRVEMDDLKKVISETLHARDHVTSKENK
jgi:DNA-binding response OmpR family regulator